MPPLVTCVLPSANRRSFLEQAIRCFLQQRYAQRELVLVTGEGDSFDDIIPAQAPIRHLHAGAGASLGQLLNLGIDAARGTIIQKLDDDDYYAPGFLDATVTALLATGSEHAIVAAERFLVLLAESGELKVSGGGWQAGSTLCFHRSLWVRHPFRDASRAVDYGFFADHGVSAVPVSDPELYILVRHGYGHTWTHLGQSTVTDYFRRQPSYAKPLEACLASEADRAFYRRLLAHHQAQGASKAQ